MKLLTQILALKRGHNSEGERAFVKTILNEYAPTPYQDDKGMTLAYVITTDPSSKTLFSCHIDTVHATDAAPANPCKYDEVLNLYYKDDNTPLGADDGAGIWLMLKMVEARVPGVYVFHRGEEKGGIGSKGMADYYEDFLRQFDRAIAFDRRGSTSVITHQGWGRCCSDDFAEALSAELNLHGLFMVPDATGIYTDTAEYTHIIPECTNISCGYDREHTGHETLDAGFLNTLLDACLLVDWGALPVVRSAEEQDTYGYMEYLSSKPGGSSSAETNPMFMSAKEVSNMGWRKLLEWVRHHPDEAADKLMELADELTYADDEDYTSSPFDELYPDRLPVGGL